MPINNKTFAELITFTRASTATRVNASGLIETVAADVPRFDYDPSTLLLRGLLIEGTRTNLLLRSEEFDNAAWMAVSAAVTANAATSPDGTTDADKLIVSNGITLGVNTGAGVRQSVTKAGFSYAYSLSLYAKAAEFNKLFLYMADAAGTANAYVRFNLDAGTVDTPVNTGLTNVSAIIQVAGNGWYKCTLMAQSTTSTTLQNLIFPGDSVATVGNGTSGVLIWGAQLELAVFPSSYIPTTTASAARASELALANNALVNTLIGPEYTLVIDYNWGVAPNYGAGTRTVLNVGDNTTSNRISLGGAVNRAVSLAVVNANVTTVNINNTGTPAMNTALKSAFRMKAGAWGMKTNTSGVVVTSAVGTMPPRTNIVFGSNVSNTSHMFGYIRNVQFLPYAASDTELATLAP